MSSVLIGSEVLQVLGFFVKSLNTKFIIELFLL